MARCRLAALALLAMTQAGSLGAQSEGRLPAPDTRGALPVEDLMARRRSVRSFTTEELTPAMLGQLLWAAQGVTDPEGLRTAPSAGALYPLELYVVTGSGVFRYLPDRHELVAHARGDQRAALEREALGQDAVGEAPAVFVITAVFSRTAAKYGTGRARRYVHLEAGHAAQNLLLQAVALGLGGVPIGAFEDRQVQAVLDLPRDHEPLYLIPVGRPR